VSELPLFVRLQLKHTRLLSVAAATGDEEEEEEEARTFRA